MHYEDNHGSIGTIRRLPQGWVRFMPENGQHRTIRPDTLTPVEVEREPDNGPATPLQLPPRLPVMVWDAEHEAYGHVLMIMRMI